MADEEYLTPEEVETALEWVSEEYSTVANDLRKHLKTLEQDAAIGRWLSTWPHKYRLRHVLDSIHVVDGQATTVPGYWEFEWSTHEGYDRRYGDLYRRHAATAPTLEELIDIVQQQEAVKYE